LTTAGRLTSDGVLPPVELAQPGEFQVFHLIGQGLSKREIAATCHRIVRDDNCAGSRDRAQLQHLRKLAPTQFISYDSMLHPVQSRGYLAVRQPLSDQVKHLELAGAEPLDGGSTASEVRRPAVVNRDSNSPARASLR